MKKAIVMFFLFSAASIMRAQQFWKDATIKTQYGAMKLSNMYLSRDAENRSCEFSADLENTTGVSWDNAKVTVIAADEFEFVRVVIDVPRLAGDTLKAVSAPCNYEIRIIPTTISAVLIGTPNQDDVAAYQRNHGPQSKDRKTR